MWEKDAEIIFIILTELTMDEQHPRSTWLLFCEYDHPMGMEWSSALFFDCLYPCMTSANGIRLFKDSALGCHKKIFFISISIIIWNSEEHAFGYLFLLLFKSSTHWTRIGVKISDGSYNVFTHLFLEYYFSIDRDSSLCDTGFVQFLHINVFPSMWMHST